MKKLNMTLKDFAQLSINGKVSGELDCDLVLDVDGEQFTAYTVSVAHQDLLFYCDKGTVSYVVDNYGGDARAELFEVNKGE